MEQELQNGAGNAEVQVEGAVDELEMAGAAVHEPLQCRQEGLKREGPDRDVEGRKAEFTGERAAAGRLDVKDAVGQVLVGVFLVGEGDLVKGGQGRGQDVRGALAVEQVTGEPWERQVGLATDDVVGPLRKGLLFGFVAHLGSAKDDLDGGPEGFKELHNLGGQGGVPDVDADADDAGPVFEDGLHNVHGPAVQVELQQDGAVAQIPQVGLQIAQTEGRVNVLGVERGQDDVRHAAFKLAQGRPGCDFGFVGDRGGVYLRVRCRRGWLALV
ncbi:MAG: hypothetical protein KatS3mg132_519 [Limisphaera sp.]|nr:MAG: hypothetical protein KatS3mg132_519 [Limisphaera sp.]